MKEINIFLNPPYRCKNIHHSVWQLLGIEKIQIGGHRHGNQGAKNVKFTPNFTNFCSNVSCHIHPHLVERDKPKKSESEFFQPVKSFHKLTAAILKINISVCKSAYDKKHYCKVS
jgi:hypothetical protein